MREFLLALPIAFERDDIRIVHAARHTEAIKKVRANEGRPILEPYEEWHQATKGKLNAINPLEAKEKQGWPRRTHYKHDVPQMLHVHVQKDVISKNNIALCVLTSGIEDEA